MTTETLEETCSAIAVEQAYGFFHVISDAGEIVLYEGGCLFNPGIRQFGFPYDDLAKQIRVPCGLLLRLKQDISELGKLSEKYGHFPNDEVENVERRILKDERVLALLAQEQGVDLRVYFEHYEEKSIDW